MKSRDEEKLVIRYLLGDLPEPERAAVEDRFFADDEFYAFMQAIQEELIDDYVQGALSRRDRQLFEEHFLASPRRRERVEFASALATALTASKAPPEAAASWWQSLLAPLRAQGAAFTLAAAAMLLLVIGLAWLAVENRRLGASLEQARRDRDAATEQSKENQAEFERRRQELEHEIADLRARGAEADAKLQEKQRELEKLEQARQAAKQPQSPLSSVVSFALAPGVVRTGSGSEFVKLAIPGAARSVRLQLDLEREEPYRSFRAEVRGGDKLIWSQEGLTMRPTRYGWAVFLRLPVGILSGGEYEVTLKGVADSGQLEDVAFYSFIPVRK